MRANLMRNGATPEEAEFISEGRRVELNAFTSGDLVAFIEAKLAGCGIQKVIPDPETQLAAYRRALRNEFIQDRFGDLKEEADEFVAAATAPTLTLEVSKLLQQDPSLPWDEAVRRVACDGFHSDRGTR